MPKGTRKIKCPCCKGDGKIDKPKELTRVLARQIFENHMMSHFSRMDKIRTETADLQPSQ